MDSFFGDKLTQKFYLGDKLVDKLYLGDQLVWAFGPITTLLRQGIYEFTGVETNFIQSNAYGIGQYDLTGFTVTASYVIGLGEAIYSLSGGDLTAETSFPFSAVKLLCGFNGADGSTAFVDESSFARTLTAGGNAQIDTAWSAFGTGSALFDGVNDSISAASSADFEFGAEPFSVEACVRFSSLTGAQVIVGKWGSSPRSWVMSHSSGVMTFSFNHDGVTSTLQATSGFAANTKYHVAADRSGDTFRLYIDGVMVDSITGAFTLTTSTRTLRMGNEDTLSVDFAGWLDEVRIIKGYTPYGSDAGFTVPTAAFPRN